MKKLTAGLVAGLFCCFTVSLASATEEAAQKNLFFTAPNPVSLDGVSGHQSGVNAEDNIGEATTLQNSSVSSSEVIDCLPSPIVTQNSCTVNALEKSKDGQSKAQGKNKAKQPAAKKGTLVAQSKQAKCATQHNSPPPAAGVGKQIKVKAYAYCIQGRTASGTRTGLGTIAVDPALIPLGSKVYIPGYGWGTALDTGGHMRGSVIDIWYPSNSECMRWGVRSVTVTVLPR
ncbi:MAG: 3D domain-containing protein [bacterium]|nr:3D domain-containing protein [bacterium]